MKNKWILQTIVLIFICTMLLSGSAQSQNTASQVPKGEYVQVIELRNYLLKPGKRDSFINGFNLKVSIP